MKFTINGVVVGEVKDLKISEKLSVDVSLINNYIPSVALVVWDEDFAVAQLERLLRAPFVFERPVPFKGPVSFNTKWIEREAVEFQSDSPVQVEEVPMEFMPIVYNPSKG